MVKLRTVNRPKTRKGKKVLLAREPQLIEPPKQTLIIRGRTVNDAIRDLLGDLHQLKNPNAKKLQEKLETGVFGDCAPVEKACNKFDCNLFAIGSNLKKAPNSFVLGRIYDGSLLDMIEFEILNYRGMNSFKGEKLLTNIKPCMIFSGENWDSSDDLKQTRSILIDFFHREVCESVDIMGLEHVLHFVADTNNEIFIRSYRMKFSSASKDVNGPNAKAVPQVGLNEIGPRVQLKVRRGKYAAPDLMKEACKRVKVAKSKSKKNKSRDELGNSFGRIHLGKQHTEKIQTRKTHALKKHVSLPTAEE